MQRSTLILFSGTALGLTISSAIPIVGRLIPGVGQGGAIALGVLTVIGIVATPRDHRHVAIIISFICWIAFGFSAYNGGLGHG
jgi:hypothetical protein